MRKYIIGCLIGITLATASNVYAKDVIESLVGKKVEGTLKVKLDGKAVNKEAVVIDGSSYLPLRAAGESLGLKVDFKNNEVTLDSKGGAETSMNSSTNTLVRYDGKLTESKYNGIKSVEYEGQTYFAMFFYNENHRETFIPFDNKNRSIKVQLNGQDKTIWIENADPNDFILYNGESYLNVKYYPQ